MSIINCITFWSLSRWQQFELCNHPRLVKFNRTCAAKYPLKHGSRSKLPSLPASDCERSPATWPFLKAPSSPGPAASSGRRASRLQKSLAKPVECTIVSACEAAAQTMQARAERHVERGGHHRPRPVPVLEKMEPAEILEGARNLEQFDYVARRNYGVENQPSPGGLINLAILTNQAVVVESKPL